MTKEFIVKQEKCRIPKPGINVYKDHKYSTKLDIRTQEKENEGDVVAVWLAQGMTVDNVGIAWTW